MESTEKLTMVKSLLSIAGTDEDAQLNVFLTAAEKEILAWRYSYAEIEMPTAVPAEYEMTQVFAVVAGYTQQGGEGETEHSENGVSRKFRYEDMVSYIRHHVIPICRVM